MQYLSTLALPSHQSLALGLPSHQPLALPFHQSLALALPSHQSLALPSLQSLTILKSPSLEDAYSENDNIFTIHTNYNPGRQEAPRYLRLDNQERYAFTERQREKATQGTTVISISEFKCKAGVLRWFLDYEST
jgi:hypothetical protein